LVCKTGQARSICVSSSRPEVCKLAGDQGADRPEVEEIVQLGWNAALRLLQ
jgi:hypothetical protein